MDAALHSSDGKAFEVANHEISSVTNGSAARKGGNLSVGNTNSILQFVGESTESGAKNKSYFGTKGRARQDSLRGAVGVEEFVEVGQGEFQLRPVLTPKQYSRIATNVFTTENTELIYSSDPA
jgi:hypothetical protein